MLKEAQERGLAFILLMAFRHVYTNMRFFLSGLNLCRRYLRYAPEGLRACLLTLDKPCDFK